MNKKKIYKFLYFFSVLFILGFIIRLGVDYFKYNPIITSAPFYVYIIERAVEFIVPSLILFVVAQILKKKS